MKIIHKYFTVVILFVISLFNILITNEATADITPPALTILSPADGKTIWVDGPGLYPVIIVFSATDVGGDTPLGNFSLGVDGTFTPIASLSPWGIIADTYVTSWTPGSGSKNYTLQVRADDNKGNTGFSREITVKVRVQPTMTMSTFPGDGKLLIRDNDNTICISCHALKTHSSASIGSTKYGNWERICRDCHTPHNTRNIFLLVSSFKIYTGETNQGYSTNRKVDFRNLSGHSAYGFTTADGYEKRGPCEVCHTRTNHFRFDGTGPQQKHENIGGPDRFATETCINQCHLHTSGFAHGDGNNCVNCHGHEPGTLYDPDMTLPYEAGTQASPGRGTVIPHSTHTEIDSDDERGPGIYCNVCHNLDKIPFFNSGTDVNGDGLYDLSETDVCDGCHSPGGAFNGVKSTDGSVGAKDNWHTGGVYNNNTALKPGKEKWCVGCHDLGTSVIPIGTGRQAPGVAGNNSSYGFYVSGHGSKAQECGNCHKVSAKHNFDGKKTYEASLDNYQAGYRLKDVNGQPPMNIPLDGNDAGYGDKNCNFDENNYRLCITCHESKGPTTMGTAENLFSDTKAAGHHGCETNPYKNASSMITGFRNESPSGFYFGSVVPGNGHWDHMVEFSNFFGPKLWKSDDSGIANSRMSCPACHNPHGDSYGADIPTIRMTRSIFEIEWANDAVGDHGVLGSTTAFSNTCAVSCHFDSDPTLYKYYRDHTSPFLSAITLSDNNSSDPLPAEAGYTNSINIDINFDASGAAAEEMQCAEDNSFTINATGWIAYESPYNYSLSDSEGSKTVYCQLRSTGGSSHIKSNIITVDRNAPIITSSTLTAPNGSEIWIQGTNRDITWSSITDDNLKDLPISLDYSTDSGVSYVNSISGGTDNDGIYSWLTPTIESNTLRVRLSVYDKAGNMGSDSSDADFTLQPVPPALSAISLSDNNSADPEPAVTGYTNSQSVNVSLSVSDNPAEMLLAEDTDFTVNSTGWITFSADYTYNLTATNGTKTVYSKVRNSAGESSVQSNSIILDTINPTMLSTTLTSPNGGEFWATGSGHNITWNSGDISDLNLKSTPVSLSYSSNGGSSYEVTLFTDNDGTWYWTLPSETTHEGMIRIRAYDKAGNTSEDTSDGYFFISPSSNYIVTNTNDSGTGSLRQAITNLEGDLGNGTIWFNIPSESLTNGVAFINISSELLLSQPGVVIDATSQTSLIGNTNIYGPEVRIIGLCASIFSCPAGTAFNVSNTASNTVIKGFQITENEYAIKGNATGMIISENHFGFSSDNTGSYVKKSNKYNITLSSGSSNAAIGNNNYISCGYYEGLKISASGFQVLNNFFGIMPDGTACKNNDFGGYASISLGSSASNGLIQNNAVGGSIYGIELLSGASNNTIKGNTFGVYYESSTWKSAVNQSDSAIYISNSSGNTIGGPNIALDDSTLNDSNVISAGSVGIKLNSGSNNKVYGNFIGINPEQDETFSGTVGVRTIYATNSLIGGGDTGEAGNVISNMSLYGVNLSNAASDYIKMSRNSFFNNGDESGDDAIFITTGANNDIARPAITAATTTTVTVGGVTNGDRVEVFLSDYDGAGTEYGEGKTFIGSAIASGTSVEVPVSGVVTNDWVTAITIQPDKDTSAFSSNFQIP